ncbi:MAG: sialate O-acetylesterase [Sphingobacteriales bacterium]|nr:sialate O-acetylesterase [Sphingobacteriales bacterium]
MIKITKKLSVFICCILFVSCVNAALKLPSILNNNMVLQRDKPIHIWGWANAGQKVTVNFLNKMYTTITDKKGKWNVFLVSAKAGNGGNMIISTTDEKIELKNILIGEVWVCSGQSNMEFELSSFKDFYADEIKSANNDNIRYITIQNTINNKEQDNVSVKYNWSSVNPQTVVKSSAVAYFFAKKLYERLHVPIGLVISAWGGTPAQSWIDTTVVKQFPNYAEIYDKSLRNLDLTKLAEIKEENNKKFQQEKAKVVTEFKNYLSINYDDSKWEATTLPGNWESKGHPDFDGLAAYRIEFNVSKEDAGKEATLHLPAIDDIDSTYINGTFLGSQTVWNELRTYKIPANVLVEGKNMLTIWVEDDQGGGGLNSDVANYYIETSTTKIELKGKARLKLLLPLLSVLPGVNLSGMQNSPTLLFNGMIAPLLPLSIRGAIWYQGEANADRYVEYRKLFPAMITNWRKRWQQGNFPFLFVQLASYNPNENEPEVSDWAFLREAQSMTRKLPNTGMAVTVDVGDKNDIHPKQKKEVGERLAANAFKIVYGYKNEIAAGPALSKAIINKNSIAIQYKNIGSGLMVKGDALHTFTIAGADKKFYPATATLSGNHINVSSDKVNHPLYVRYAWASSPLDANLYNKEGFPAEPFRTDK